MLQRNLLLTFIALSSGATIAMSVFAFIEKIGLISRITARTKTAKYTIWYQNMIVLGIIAGNAASLFEIHVPLEIIGAVMFGLFSGMYAGCLAKAIAETLDFIPYFFYKSKLKFGLSVVIFSIAIGKGAGTLYQLIIRK